MAEPSPSSVRSTESSASLLGAYLDRRAALQQRIDSARGVDEAAGALQRVLEEVRDQAIRHQTVEGARATHALIAALSAGARALGGPLRTQVRVRDRSGPAGAGAVAQIGLTAIQLGACVVLLMAPLQLPMLAWFVVLGLAVLLGIELMALSWRAIAGRREARLVAAAFGAAADPTQPAAERAEVTIRPDGKHVCDQLADALGAIDQALAARAAAGTPAVASSPLSGWPDLLEWLQRLLGAAGASDAQEALSLSRQARQLLLRHRIQVCDLEGLGSREREELFEVEPDITGRLMAPVTQLPALLEGTRVLLRGRVIEPGAGVS